ncbi:Tat pathway signal protein [Methylobacterium sp. 17Sr1-1]|uniref:Tat pathway signal protein n=1 Tax=Methylobacterium sp. 17Sr1-1 TaxID=2202826 RepID=UPI001FE0F7D8|nr:Tat pathway signal protein [Methylobacterium sp. 17Sr1-1]
MALAVPEESHDVLTQGLPRFGARIGRVTALCLALSPLAAASQAQATSAEATVTPAAVSQPAASPLRVELNKLETAGETCKAMLIVENGKGGPIRSLRLDLYAFDQDGIVQKRSLVELGPVPARKTALRQFEIAPTPCAQIGRVLLNDVAACEGKETSGQDLTRDTCLERIEPSSAKGAAPFVR